MGFSVHGISQARILEWVAISFSRGSFRPGIEPTSPALVGGFFFTTEPPREARLSLSWTSLVAQVGQNPPAMWETGVQSLDWEDSLEKGPVTHSSILDWRIPWTI